LNYSNDDSYGIIATSTNGLDWSLDATDRTLWCVTATDDSYTIAATYNLLGFDPTAELFSPAEIEPVTLGPANWVPIAMAYGEGILVGVLGESGILLSPSFNNPLPFADPEPEGDFYGVAYGFGRFAAVGREGKIITSETGESWQLTITPTRADLFDVGPVGNRFVAVGANGTVLISPEQHGP
jgi:hypothetical protein